MSGDDTFFRAFSPFIGRRVIVALFFRFTPPLGFAAPPFLGVAPQQAQMVIVCYTKDFFPRIRCSFPPRCLGWLLFLLHEVAPSNINKRGGRCLDYMFSHDNTFSGCRSIPPLPDSATSSLIWFFFQQVHFNYFFFFFFHCVSSKKQCRLLLQDPPLVRSLNASHNFAIYGLFALYSLCILCCFRISFFPVPR